MIHPKNIGIAAGLGFLLSFLIGIISGIGFGHVLLRALIFAVIFAALAAGISFLSQKFLSVEQSDAVSDASAEKAPRVGGVVDIKIDDDRLPEEDQGPQFNVGLTRAALRQDGSASRPVAAPVPPPQAAPQPSAPSATQEPVAAQNAPVAQVASQAPSGAEPVTEESAGFTPMNLAQVASAGASQKTASQASPVAESASVETAPAQAAEPVPSASAAAGLEELPDMGMFGGDEEEHAADGGDGAAEEDDFSGDTDTSYVRSVTSIDESAFQDKSASVMAQAIRTVLAKDK